MLIRPAIGDTDPIRYRRPTPDGQFSGNILDEAMRPGSRRRGSLIYTSFCRYGLSEDHIATTPHDINRFRIAALSLDDYAAGLAHDAGQSAYDLFKDYPQSPA